MVVLRLSVVPRGRAVGLLATKGNPPPNCSGQGEGRSFLAESRYPPGVSLFTSSQMRKTVSVSLTSLRRNPFLRAFSQLLWGETLFFGLRNKKIKKKIFFVLKKTLLCLDWSWEVEEFAVLETPVPKKSFHYSGPSPMRPNELRTYPDTEPPGLAPGCQRR